MPIQLNTVENGVSSLVQGGVTWTFASPVSARQTVDGAWVVQGPVVVSSVTPDVSGTGAALRNGLMVNPLHFNDPNHVGQAWDGRDSGTFDESVEASSFPLTLYAGSVAVKCVSSTIASQDFPQRAGYPEEAAALYVVDDLGVLPVGDFFSPSPIGWTGRSGFDFYESRVTSAVAGFPSYAVTGHASRDTYTDIAAKVNRFQAMAGYNQFDLVDSGYQTWLTFESGRTFVDFSNGSSNYGQFVMKFQEQAALGMIGDEWTTEQKETLLIALASMGIHLIQLGIGANNGGTDFYDNYPNGIGGHCQWSQIPMDCAILASANTPKPAELYQVSPSNMLLQAFEMTPALLARLTRHTNADDPFDYRERSVIAVDTVSTPNTITVDMTLGGENFRISTSSNKRVVATDSSFSSLMADPLGTATLTEAATLIPVQDASGFAGKTVYFEAVTPFEVGEYLWLDQHWRTNFNVFDTELRAAYSGINNRWAGWTLFACATGVWDAQRTPAIRWTQNRALGVRDQTPPFESAWSEEFWTEHAETIFAATIDATNIKPRFVYAKPLTARPITASGLTVH